MGMVSTGSTAGKRIRAKARIRQDLRQVVLSDTGSDSQIGGNAFAEATVGTHLRHADSE